MKKPMIRVSYLTYIGVAALCLAYSIYFVIKLYKMPFLPHFDFLTRIYIFGTVPAIWFSVAAFISVVVYTMIPVAVGPKLRLCFLEIAGLTLLAYGIAVLLALLSPRYYAHIALFMVAHPVVLAVPGILFAIGFHKKETSRS